MTKPTKPKLPLRARARPTPGKLTPEVLGRICAAIAQGEHRAGACAAQGVTDSALRKLRAEHPEVDEQVAEAEAKGATYYRKRVAEAEAGKDARDDWKRWAWLGERLHPSAFAPPPKRVEQSGPDGGPQEVAVSGAVSISLADAVRIARGESES
jgi:hypothetical protein